MRWSLSGAGALEPATPPARLSRVRRLELARRSAMDRAGNRRAGPDQSASRTVLMGSVARTYERGDHDHTTGATHRPLSSGWAARYRRAPDRCGGRGRCRASGWGTSARSMQESASVAAPAAFSASAPGLRLPPSGVTRRQDGERAGERLGGAPSGRGAAYNPVTHRWRRLGSAPAAVLPDNAAWTWTGHQVFIFGGPSLPDEAATHRAGLYAIDTTLAAIAGP